MDGGTNSQLESDKTVTPGDAAAAAPRATTPPAPVPQPEAMAPRSVAVPPAGSDGSITWTASEFVAHHKSVGWYGVLALGAVILAAIIWLLTRDLISAIVVIVAAVVFGFYGARQPRELQYSLSSRGLSIGPRHFALEQFRSFSIITEGAFSSIVFVPLKRFAPLVTIYYDPADEPKIVALLSDTLPHAERERDMIDRIMWRIRF